jgi:hypothetical protein
LKLVERSQRHATNHTSHSAEAAKNYFDGALKTSDYHTKDIGIWGGKGAEFFGREGDVERKDFVALANNKWPGVSGKRLTARMNATRLKDVIDQTGMPTIRSRDRIPSDLSDRPDSHIPDTQPIRFGAAEKASVAIFLGVPIFARGIGDTK